VYIRSKKPIPVRTSSHVSVKVKGVMGERFIEITVGDEKDPLIDKDEVIDGIFEMGPSEAIAYIDMLTEKITELKDLMLWLRDGKDGERSFVTAFNDIIEIIDTLALKLLTGLDGVETGLSAGLYTASDVVDKTIRITADIATKAPELMEDLSSFMIKVDSLASKTERVFTQLSKITETIDGNNLLWSDHVEKIQGHLVEIRKYMDEFRREGLPLTVRPRFW
jgi:ABC-type transporter Mla subunit MlaD